MIFFDGAIITGRIFLMPLLNKDQTYSLLKKGESADFLAIPAYYLYLFNFQFFTIGISFIPFFKLQIVLNEFLFFTSVIPLTFISSYYIQIKEKNLLSTEKSYYLSIISRRKLVTSSGIIAK
jgi:hypothetical protein